MVTEEEQGIFWPQNAQYSNTSLLVAMIAKAHGKRVRLIKGFGWALKILSHVSGLVNKAFGSLSYDADMSEYKIDYRIVDLEESVMRTEKD
jgi:UDP-glucose 4-epimerase